MNNRIKEMRNELGNCYLEMLEAQNATLQHDVETLKALNRKLTLAEQSEEDDD